VRCKITQLNLIFQKKDIYFLQKIKPEIWNFDLTFYRKTFDVNFGCVALCQNSIAQ
jgi:hypothetical protein